MAKLLLVEDDNNLREIYEARLQAEGYTIVSAKDGEEALAVAKAEKPDLVISDVMMPKISGFEMLDILRNTNDLKNIKVIMLTALGQSDDQQRANKLGADKYLVKSQVTLEDIVRSTHDLLKDTSAAIPEAAKTTPVTSSAPAPEPVVATEPTTVPAAEPATEPPPATPAEPTMPTPAPSVDPPTPEPVALDTPAPEPAVIPAPEPVSAPAAEPSAAEPTIPTPEPVVATEPTTLPAEPADATAKAAQEPASSPTEKKEDENMPAESTTEEQSDVDSQIENFVDGASSEAPPPTPGAPEPVENSEPEEESASNDQTEEETESDAADTESNDHTMAETADSLSSTTNADEPKPGDDETVVITPNEDVASGAPAQRPSVQAESETAPEMAIDSSADVNIAHKKVIKPLESSKDKPDIQTLYAMEQAKNDGGPTIPKPVVVDATRKPDDAQNPDPNSIAL